MDDLITKLKLGLTSAASLEANKVIIYMTLEEVQHVLSLLTNPNTQENEDGRTSEERAT